MADDNKESFFIGQNEPRVGDKSEKVNQKVNKNESKNGNENKSNKIEKQKFGNLNKG